MLLVHPASVHWERSRAFYRGALRPEREGRGQGLGSEGGYGELRRKESLEILMKKDEV